MPATREARDFTTQKTSGSTGSMLKWNRICHTKGANIELICSLKRYFDPMSITYFLLDKMKVSFSYVYIK